jgi:hypothetical protein
MSRILVNSKNNVVVNIQHIVCFYQQIIGFSTSSLPQSLFIKVLLKLKSEIPHFWKIIPWTNKNMFRTEDTVPEEYNNKKIMPLNERVFYAYAKTLIKDAKNNYHEAVQQLPAFINETQADNTTRHFTFVNFYLAEGSILIHNHANAYQYALKFIQNNYQKSWSWALLAKSTIDKQKRIVFLCQAIKIENNEAFLLQVRELLTELLLEAGHQFAAVENSNKIIETRKKNGWAFASSLNTLKLQHWYNHPLKGKTLKSIVESESEKALYLVFPNLISETAFVTFKQQKNYKLISQQNNRRQLDYNL